MSMRKKQSVPIEIIVRWEVRVQNDLFHRVLIDIKQEVNSQGKVVIEVL